LPHSTAVDRHILRRAAAASPYNQPIGAYHRDAHGSNKGP